MTKSRIVPRIGGALIALLVLLALLSCSDSDKHDETVSAYFALSSRDLETSNESYAGVDELYWTYTAVKQDKYFSTGQSEFDDDGNPIEADLNGGEAGLPDGSFGTFSVGSWIFTFNAYESVTETDNDGNETTSLELYYSGEASTTLTTSSKTVSVNVVLVTDGYGNLLVSGVYLADESGNTLYFLSSEDDVTEDTTYYVITDDTTYATVTLTDSDGSTVREVTDSDLAVTTAGGRYISYTDSSETDEDESLADGSDTYLIPSGYYTVTVTFFHDIDGDGTSDELGTATAEKVSVRSSLTTTVTGDTLEVTVDAEFDDDPNVTYDTYEASTADELIAYLTIDGATVVLTSDLSVDETLEIATDTVLDLGSCSLESDVAVAEGVSLSITSSSDDASSLSGTIELSSGSSLTVDGVTLSSEETGSILISASEADVTVTITDATLVSSKNGRLIDVLLTEDSDKDGTLSITISDTTAYIDAVSGGSDGASRGININGSADESDGSLSRLELVLSSVTIIDETESSSYSVYPLNICYVDEADITIEDTTIKCNTNHYATRFSAIGNADRTSTITITESTLQGYSAITAKYMTNVVMDITSSSLLGYNYNDGDDDDFCTIYLSYAIGTTINVDKSTVAFMEYGDATQALAGIEWILTSSYANNSINFTNCTLEWNNKPEEESDERAFYNLENWYSDCTLSDDEDYVVSGTLCSNNSVNLDEATQQSLGIYGDDSSYVTYMDYLWLIGEDADLAWTGQNNLLQLRTE